MLVLYKKKKLFVHVCPKAKKKKKKNYQKRQRSSGSVPPF